MKEATCIPTVLPVLYGYLDMTPRTVFFVLSIKCECSNAFVFSLYRKESRLRMLSSILASELLQL